MSKDFYEDLMQFLIARQDRVRTEDISAGYAEEAEKTQALWQEVRDTLPEEAVQKFLDLESQFAAEMTLSNHHHYQYGMRDGARLMVWLLLPILQNS